MKKVKLHIPAEQIVELDNMLKQLLATPLHIADLQLERLILLEFYNRNVRRFVFMDSKPIPLTMAEALALNRFLLATNFVTYTAKEVAKNVIWQLDRLFMDNKQLNG